MSSSLFQKLKVIFRIGFKSFAISYVFIHMKLLATEAGVLAKYMKGATFMIPTPRLLDQVVQMIDKVQMTVFILWVEEDKLHNI